MKCLLLNYLDNKSLFRFLISFHTIYRFGRVFNKEVRGFAVRGWNYLKAVPEASKPNAWQQYCFNEKSFADCFEKVDETGRESGIEGYFEIHGNYYQGKYEPSIDPTYGGESNELNFGENALGVVCH